MSLPSSTLLLVLTSHVVAGQLLPLWASVGVDAYFGSGVIRRLQVYEAPRMRSLSIYSFTPKPGFNKTCTHWILIIPTSDSMA